MVEPTSTSTFTLAALAIALAGPLFGPHALILFAALAGSLWAISAVPAASRMASAWVLIRCTTLSVAITGAISYWLASQYGLPALELLAPVAFFCAALGNGWRSVFDSMLDAVKSLIGRFSTSNDSGRHGQ